ncbi:MAG: pyridoxal-phosphate dependent enzyme [Alphaproteobacteria bacterium]|nr:pyridoxal-phosphate dependent enzyme [Alphaproteobacteria bacterium]
MYLYCPVCGKEYPLETNALFCPESTENGIHPLIKQENPAELARVFPTTLTKRWNDKKLSFSVFREFMASYQLAAANGKASWWVERVLALSDACERITGRGFIRTPEIQADDLALAIDLPKGSLFVKNETLQLMGSHKSRHFAGIIMHLETLREISDDPAAAKKTLAIYSQGSAVMEAAAIAGAAGYQLYAFVPGQISEEIISVLTNLGTKVIKVDSETQEADIDLCRQRYQEALKKFDWFPLTPYGLDVWSAVEGAETMEYEFLFNQYLIDAPLDVQVVQVGGGSLANAVASANSFFKSLNIIRKLPRLYTCQTMDCYPLAQSYFLVLRELGRKGVVTLPPELAMLLEGNFDAKALMENNLGQIKMTAGLIAEMYPKISSGMETVFAAVGKQRNEFFKAWIAEENTLGMPVNDRMYDGLEIVRHMIISGGLPLIAGEDELQKAQDLAQAHTGIELSVVGSAGLAGLRLLIKNKLVRQGERCGIFFSGTKINSHGLSVVQNRVITLTDSDDISKLSD